MMLKIVLKIVHVWIVSGKGDHIVEGVYCMKIDYH